MNYFNGITCSYSDGFVWGDALWVEGYVVENICWYPDGSGLIYFYKINYDEDKSQYCDIRLDTNPTELMFSYSQEQGKLKLDIHQHDFNYLFNMLP